MVIPILLDKIAVVFLGRYLIKFILSSISKYLFERDAIEKRFLVTRKTEPLLNVLEGKLHLIVSTLVCKFKSKCYKIFCSICRK